ncbi:MAG: AsmA family protein [Pseudomonadota bacterium]
MSWVLRIVGGLVLLLVVAALVLPMVLKTEDLVEQAETAASDELGRKVSIGEVTGLSLLPPRITISDFEVANAEGFSAPYLVRVDEARFAVALMPLLRGQVQIDAFVLESPSINLEEKADGRTNYDFEVEAADTASDDAGEDTADAPSDTADVTRLSGTIRISNGALTYVTPDMSYSATDTNITVGLPGERGALSLDGAMTLEGVPFSLDVRIDKPGVLSSGGTSPARIGLQFADNTIDSNLSLTGEPVNLQGTIKGNLPDVAGLKPLLGAEGVEALLPMGAITFDADMTGTTDRLDITDATIGSSVLQGTADFGLALMGERPKATGEANLSLVDLRPFMPEEEASSGSGGGGPAEAEPFPEWSDEEIDLSALTTIDADLNVNAARIVLPTYELTDVASKVVLENGTLTATLSRARAFSGNAGGVVIVEANRPTPVVDVDFDMTGVSFADAAPALLGTDRLTGSGDINLDLRMTGTSQKDWVETLTGSMGADINQGAIAGINLGEIANTGIDLVNQVQAGTAVPQAILGAAANLGTNAVRPTATTDFDLADFGITLTNGEASIGNAQLLSDVFRARLGGQVSLAPQSFNMDINLAGKDPQVADFTEMPLPVTVSGTFNDPKIKVDTQPMVNRAVRGAASDLLGNVGVELNDEETVEDALRNRARSEASRLLGGFLGGGSSDDDDDPQ